MNTAGPEPDEDDLDPTAEPRVRAELEPLTIDPDPGWSASLGDELHRDRLRRGIGDRPRGLWIWIGLTSMAGVALLLLALAQG